MDFLRQRNGIHRLDHADVLYNLPDLVPLQPSDQVDPEISGQLRQLFPQLLDPVFPDIGNSRRLQRQDHLGRMRLRYRNQFRCRIPSVRRFRQFPPDPVSPFKQFFFRHG